MQWISVKDKLPTDLDTCALDYFLVYGLSGTALIGIAQYDKDDKRWYFMDDNKVGVNTCLGPYPFDDKNITHWMPLPNSPEG